MLYMSFLKKIWLLLLRNCKSKPIYNRLTTTCIHIPLLLFLMRNEPTGGLTYCSCWLIYGSLFLIFRDDNRLVYCNLLSLLHSFFKSFINGQQFSEHFFPENILQYFSCLVCKGHKTLFILCSYHASTFGSLLNIAMVSWRNIKCIIAIGYSWDFF